MNTLFIFLTKCPWKTKYIRDGKSDLQGSTVNCISSNSLQNYCCGC